MSVKKIGPVKKSSWGWESKRVELEAREGRFYVCDEKLTIKKIKDMTQTRPIRVARESRRSLPLPLLGFLARCINLDLSEFYYLYKNNIYCLDKEYSENETLLLIMDYEDKERQKFERLKKKFELAEKVERESRRESIPEEVRIAVWRRDGGKCARCGSREKLEYDHIIPISKGGSNTVRNIELLCENCNRKKKDSVS